MAGHLFRLSCRFRILRETKCRSYSDLGTNAGIVGKLCLTAHVYARTVRHFKIGGGSSLSATRIWRCSQPLYLLQRPFLLWPFPSLGNRATTLNLFWRMYLKQKSLSLLVTQEMRAAFYVL